MNYSRQRGFTLIELMVVVAIVAILAAIAYPSYQEQVRKTRRADATGALMGLASAMERHFTNTGSYTGAATGGGDTGSPAATTFSSTSPVDGGTAAYNLKIHASTATTFTLYAERTGPQTGDKCGTLTLANDGTKGVSGADSGVTAADCWN